MRRQLISGLQPWNNSEQQIKLNRILLRLNGRLSVWPFLSEIVENIITRRY